MLGLSYRSTSQYSRWNEYRVTHRTVAYTVARTRAHGETGERISESARPPVTLAVINVQSRKWPQFDRSHFCCRGTVSAVCAMCRVGVNRRFIPQVLHDAHFAFRRRRPISTEMKSVSSTRSKNHRLVLKRKRNKLKPIRPQATRRSIYNLHGTLGVGADEMVNYLIFPAYLTVFSKLDIYCSDKLTM